MSFNFMGYYRVGSYRVFRSFALNQLRSARQRILTIENELGRIGEIGIAWKTTSEEGTAQRVSEERVGISVTPDTSLARLVQAYVAQGGNPFDISMFLDPYSSSWELADEEGLFPAFEEHQSNPYGGVLYPMSRVEEDYQDGGLGGVDSGGMLTGLKNPKRRMGETPAENREFYSSTVRKNYLTRKALKQVMRDKRNNLEWKITKMMDLREQLEEELAWIRCAAGGFVAGVTAPPVTIGADLALVDLFQSLDDEIFYTEDGINKGVDESRLRQGIRTYIFVDYEAERWTAL